MKILHSENSQKRLCYNLTLVFAASVLSRLDHKVDFFGNESDFGQRNGLLSEEAPPTTTEAEIWTETSTESNTVEQTTTDLAESSPDISSSSMAPTTHAASTTEAAPDSTTMDDVFTTLGSTGSTTLMCKGKKKKYFV
jgi:hypothetical protein